MTLPYDRAALRGRVAVVAGATRGAGRGIAAALGEPFDDFLRVLAATGCAHKPIPREKELAWMCSPVTLAPAFVTLVSPASLRIVPTRKSLNKSSVAVSVELVERRIYLIRGHKVMIDIDLAELYQVPTKRLNEQVRRNRKRFPEDFMFQLTKEETESLRSQLATSKTHPEALRSQFATSKISGGRRYLRYAFNGAFTE